MRIASAKLPLFIMTFLLHAWMAGIVSGAETHPCVLYTAADSASIRARLVTQPYLDWFIAEQNYADGILTKNVDWSVYVVAAETKAFYAKVLAFVWAFSDISHEHRDQWEEAALLSLYYLPQNTYNPPFTSDLAVSEAAVFWAEAYDILKSGGSDFTVDGYGDLEPLIRSKLKSLRDYMARDSYELFPGSPRIGNDFVSVAWVDVSYTDNHHVKLQAALAILSLVIADESGSQDDLDHALSRFRGALGNLAIPAGGWAEGPDYLLYSAHEYVAAINALKNTGAADIYAEMPELVATHLMLPRMVMPDGYLPPWDDSGAVVFDLAGLLWSHHADQPGRDLLHWMWTTAGSPVPIAFRTDYIAGFDDTPPVYVSPDGMDEPSTGFYPESGFARFRDSWDDDAVYLLLQAEHGDLHASGRAHEHPDQNAFMLHAFGELLLLDTGYGGWSYHDETRYADDHNLILIDGNGPPEATQLLSGFGVWSIDGDGAYIRDGFTSALLDYAASETSYENTILNRHVAFHGHRYFILYDTVESWNDATLSVLLHGNGGGTSGGTFTLTDMGGTWQHGGAAVDAAVIGSTGTVDLSTQTASHAVYSRTPLQTHTMLKASQQESAASFVTVLYPYRAGGPSPVITETEADHGSAVHLDGAGIDAFAGLRIGVGDVVVKDGGTTVISSDAPFVWCETTGGHIPQSLFFIDGRRAADSAGAIVTASNRLTLTLDRTMNDRISGHVQPDSAIELTFTGVDAVAVTFNGSPLSYTVLDGNTVFTVTGEGDYLITVPEPELTLSSPNGSEDWRGGESYPITWTSQYVNQIKLEYSLNNGVSWITIAESVAADTGTFMWELPGTSATQCLIRITDIDDVSVTDRTDNPFSIYLPTLTVLSPNGGEQWNAGSIQTVTWTSDYVAKVDIVYSLDSGNTWNVLAEHIAADTGLYTLTTPDTTSTECIVRVFDAVDSTVSDLSDAPFSIVKPSITVTAPNGGETWYTKDTHAITWITSGIPEIMIAYSDDYGQSWNVIASAVDAASGSYDWVLPDTPSGMCLIRLSDASDESVFDESDAAFTIEYDPDQPRITVIAPNGGERWNAGTRQEIWWESNYWAEFDIEYSFDAGNEWRYLDSLVIIEKQAQGGTQWMIDWTVPDTTAATCLVRVRSIGDSTVVDTSDSTFTIFPADAIAETSAPQSFLTVACYPNPFNPRTTISCVVSRPATVTISIYNVVGQRVRVFTLGYVAEGEYPVVFDAYDLTSGLYFYRVDAGHARVSGKLLYLR